MSEWIDCKERLPEYGIPVLVVFAGVVQHVMYTRDAGGWQPCVTEADSAPDGTFSHWMPQPELSKSRGRKIQYTWGGQGGTYTVNLRTVPGISDVYEPVIVGLKSCYEAQQATYRLNGALKRWNPDLLADGAELPGSGFEYKSTTVADLSKQQVAIGVFDISRLQGELEFSIAMALRNMSEAVAAGLMDAKLEGFHPGVSSDPKDTRAHVKVQLRLSAAIRKDISGFVEPTPCFTDMSMYKDSVMPHSAPPREPMQRHPSFFRKPCSDCVDGRCTMNCGPCVPPVGKKLEAQ